ncbi:MAG: hypothetical protein ACXV7F_06605 [Methylomonas sp.]
MKPNNYKLIPVFLLLTLAMTDASYAASTKPENHQGVEIDKVPSGKGWGEPVDAAVAPKRASLTASVSQNGIYYHGGPVMGTNAAPNVYYIWYGNWASNSAPSILTDLANHIGGSPYYNINSSYTDGNNVPVLNAVSYGGSTNDNYSQGTTLTDQGVWNVVINAMKNGLPVDSNAVYFVLTSADVKESSGFCSKYCGWHSHNSVKYNRKLVDIKFSFVGNPEQCPNACEAQTTSPNGNAGADGMASVIAHELEEAVTDPDLNAWYDSNGAENADKCAWSFGATSAAANGSKYNMTLGTRQFLIQENWVNSGGTGYCALSN